jgi:hypothetical protein
MDVDNIRRLEIKLLGNRKEFLQVISLFKLNLRGLSQLYPRKVSAIGNIQIRSSGLVAGK